MYIGGSNPGSRTPPPKPPPSRGGGFLGNLGASLVKTAPAVARAPARVTPYQPPRGGGSDAATSGPGYGAPVANAYKSTPAYKQAVVQVFNAQPLQQQHAIVQGAIRNPTVEGQTVVNYLKQSAKSIPQISTRFPEVFGHGLDVLGALSPKNFLAGEGVGPNKGPSTAGRGAVGASIIGPAFGGQKGAAQLLKNFGSDVVNYLPNTVSGLYGIGNEVAHGQFGNAFHSFVDPFVQTFANLPKSFYQHPGDTGAMFLGGKAIVGKGVGGIARVTGRDFAGTARAPLHLGTVAGEPAPIIERRSYSNDAINKAFQVAREKYLTRRGQNPNVARPAPAAMPSAVAHAFNVGPRAKLHRIADEMTAVRQMAGRQERARMLNDLHKLAPSKVARNVVTFGLQNVLRSPETVAADAVQEIRRLKAAQTDRRTAGMAANRRQVRDLSVALKTPGALDQAMQTVAKLRPLINAQDAQEVAKGLLHEDTAMGSKLLPYAMAHMGVKGPHPGIEPQFPGDVRIPPGFETHTGKLLSQQDVLDHLRAHGLPDPAFVGHFPGKVAPWRFYSAYKLARGALGSKMRTGEAFRSGAYDHTWEGLAGQVASRTEALTKATLHDNVVSRLGILKPPEMRARQIKGVFAAARAGKIPIEQARKMAGEIRTGLFTPAEAKAFAYAALHDSNHNPVPNALELTPMSTAPARMLDAVKDLQRPNELHNIGGLELKALGDAISHTAERTDQTRNVVMVPRDAAQRFAQQFAKTDSTLRQVGRVTQQFRRTVLPYSTHWMLQIGTEAGLRAALAGALDPRYIASGRRLVNRLEKTEKGRAAAMEMVNATFYNKRDPLAVHNPNPNPLVAGARALPPTRALIAAHNKYADTIGHAMYQLEHNARVMGLGKLAHKEVAEFAGSWKNAVKLQGQSLDELARRLTSDPALVAKMGRQIDDTFGKYNKFSPQVRGAIQSIAPFLPWYLNAVKYVLWHLPVHHPVATALLASARQTVNQDIQDGKNLPLSGFALQQLARLSPFGVFVPDKPGLDAALKEGIRQGTSVFLPQVMGSLYNLAGVNSFGEGPLKGPGGDVKAESGPARAAATENLAEAFLPLLSKARQAREGGRPSFGTSTIVHPEPKPGGPSGGLGTTLNRIFNPFYSFERAQQGGSTGGSGSFLLGGQSTGGSGGGYLLGGSSSSGSGGYLIP